MRGYLRRMRVDPVAFHLDAYDRLTEAFVDTFGAFDRAGFDRPRAPGKWSPGQAVEHLLRAERGTLRVITGPAEVRSDRRAAGRYDAIEALLLADAEPRASPAALAPTAERHNRVDLLDALVDVRADVRVAVAFADAPAAVATAYAHPRLGELTVLEWLCFTALHGERHRRQFA